MATKPARTMRDDSGIGYTYDTDGSIIRQDTIVIERRETITTVHSSEYGDTPMVVAAFTAAGEWLNDQASQSETHYGRLEFNYLGVTFTAGFGLD